MLDVLEIPSLVGAPRVLAAISILVLVWMLQRRLARSKVAFPVLEGAKDGDWTTVLANGARKVLEGLTTYENY